MNEINAFLGKLDGWIGGGPWFVYVLLGTGVFFTIYLRFPQIRYFKHAVKVVQGKFDRKSDKGDTSHFQALTTALSGTVGTGNIAGVALAIHLGGPAALFWMMVTAFLGMCTKFVEVLLSHKYREFSKDGSVAGGPMYYMKHRLNFTLPGGKVVKTGYWLGGFFAAATIISSFGTGNLPQINGIADSLFATFGINKMITGGVLAFFLGLVIIGGIKRIAKVTERLVPAMAIIYLIGAFGVIAFNYENIIPSLKDVVGQVFSGSAAVGGFLGASLIFAFKNGVNRGLFSNEAGQGSAPIAHSAARAHEPVSEGLVAILEPFIDTIVICFLTGLVLLSSGVWHEKFENDFEVADTRVLIGNYDDGVSQERTDLSLHFNGTTPLPLFTGTLNVEQGIVLTEDVTILHARSVAENVLVFKGKKKYSGGITIKQGIPFYKDNVGMVGKSLIHSAPLTAKAFMRGWFGSWGQYIVSIGLLLFAFSTAISWSYYGDRATVYLFGEQWILAYRLVYVAAFFVASFIDTTTIWILAGITIAFMTIPNLLGILLLHREVKIAIKDYWHDFRKEYPDEKVPKRE